MAVYGRYLRLVSALTVLLAHVSMPTARADACSNGSLLRGRTVLTSGGVRGQPAVVVDGWLLPEGRPPTHADSVHLPPGARVRIELAGPAAAMSAYVQADSRATLLVEAQGADGGFYRLFEAGPVEGGGERGRGVRFPEHPVRSLRVTNTAAFDASLSEVALFACERAQVDAARWTRAIPDADPAQARTERVGWGKVAFGLLALFLLLRVAPRLSRERGRALYGALCLLACLAWLDFGTFGATARGPLHLWDSVHYFMGSKYIREVGYTKLYDCMGQSAVRRGRGEVFNRGVMRRLDDNVRVPGSAVGRDEARCDTFTPSRAAEFDADLEALGQLPLPFGMPIEAFANDRGYMATPFGAALHHVATARATPSQSFFLGFAVVDALCLLLTVVVLALGFGLRPATFVAVAIGVGAPWDYYWLGGAFDRHTWLLVFAGALVAIHRKHARAAGVLLALLVLHRAFPAGFAMGALLFACLPRPGEDPDSRINGRHMALTFALTGALGLALGAVVAGPEAWLDFAQRLRVHVNTPVTNELGVKAALRLLATNIDGAFDPAQLDGVVPWQLRVHALDRARAPLQWLAAGAAIWVLARAALQRRSVLVGAVAGALLTLCVANIASYYAGYIVLFGALPGLSERVRSGVVLAALGTQVFVLLPLASGLDTYALTTIALVGALISIIVADGARRAGGERRVDAQRSED
jgi:hypothetical protein